MAGETAHEAIEVEEAEDAAEDTADDPWADVDHS